MVSSGSFTLNQERKTFSAFVSDFGRTFQFKQVYPDACDLGVDVVSTRTGAVSHWAIDREERQEGDIVAWHLVPIRSTVAKCRRLADWKMVIWND